MQIVYFFKRIKYQNQGQMLLGWPEADLLKSKSRSKFFLDGRAQCGRRSTVPSNRLPMRRTAGSLVKTLPLQGGDTGGKFVAFLAFVVDFALAGTEGGGRNVVRPPVAADQGGLAAAGLWLPARAKRESLAETRPRASLSGNAQNQLALEQLKKHYPDSL